MGTSVCTFCTSTCARLCLSFEASIVGGEATVSTKGMSSQESLGNQKEMELTQSIEPEQKTDIKVEDYTEVLPDGVTHTVHKERRRSLQTIHYTWKSQDGEEHTKDEVQEVPGSLM